MATFGNISNPSTFDTSAVVPVAKRAVQVPLSGKIVEPQIDQRWGGSLPGFQNNNPYYDYYFSGQDIKVSIEGTENNPQFSTLPMCDLGFSITQSKLLIYGFWSYSYDSVARGARQITGSFTLATKSPDYMTSLLKEVAQERLAYTNSSYVNTRVTDDDQNIINFWGNGTGQTMETGQSVYLYQEHPPFNLAILYGIQNTSVGTWNDTLNQDLGNNPYFVDVNERLVENNPTGSSFKVVLQACEILSMATQYVTGPDPVVRETYNFVANDVQGV